MEADWASRNLWKISLLTVKDHKTKKSQVNLDNKISQLERLVQSDEILNTTSATLD